MRPNWTRFSKRPIGQAGKSAECGVETSLNFKRFFERLEHFLLGVGDLVAIAQDAASRLGNFVRAPNRSCFNCPTSSGVSCRHRAAI